MSDAGLRQEIVGLLTGRFYDVPMESVYRVVGRVIAGVQGHDVAAVQFEGGGHSAELGLALRKLVLGAASRALAPGTVVAALTDAVHGADLGRRASGSFPTVGAFDAPPTQSKRPSGALDARSPLVTADMQVVHSDDPSISVTASMWMPTDEAPNTAPLHAAPANTGPSEDIDGSVDGIDDVDGQFRASWDPLTAVFEIEPHDMAALLAVADQLMVERGLIVQFSRAPHLGTQINGRLLLPSARGVVEFTGQVAFVQRRRVTFAFEALEPTDRRLLIRALQQKGLFEPASNDFARSGVTGRHESLAVNTSLLSGVMESSARVLANASGDVPEGNAGKLIMQYLGTYLHWWMDMYSGSVCVRLLFEGDSLVDVSDMPIRAERTTRALLLRAGACTEAQLDEAQEVASRRNLPLERILREAGEVDGQRLRAATMARLRFIFRDLLHTSVDRFRLTAVDKADISPVARLRVPDEIMEVLERRTSARDPAELRQTYITPNLTRYPTLTEESRTDALRASRPSAKFLSRFDGTKTLRQLITQSVLSAHDLAVFVAIAEQCGWVHWVQRDHREIRIAAAIKAINTRLSAIRALGDPFEVLSAHWSAYAESVDQSFDNALHAYDVQYVISHGAPPDVTLADQLRRRLQEAKQLLSDPKERRSARARVSDSASRESAARLCEQQAKIAILKGDVSRARDQYARLVELRPENEDARRQLALLG